MTSLLLAPLGVLLGLTVLALAGNRKQPAAPDGKDSPPAPEVTGCGACNLRDHCAARRTNQRKEP